MDDDGRVQEHEKAGKKRSGGEEGPVCEGQKKSSRGRKICGLLGAAVLLLAGVSMTYQKEERTYQESGKVIQNPARGFAACADYYDAAKNCSLVYVDITWREWEPAEGQYDFAQVWEDNFLEEWQQAGKQVVLRFVCDVPGEEDHLDIPDWLYDLTGADGTHYDGELGRGYSPDYENTAFQEKHEKAIAALGRYFGTGNLVAYVELGSIGHWGEWHLAGDESLSMPEDETCLVYASPYAAAFPNAKLLMRRPYEIAAGLGAGVYNDMAGRKDSTESWLEWINKGDRENIPAVTAMPSIWENYPVGGEFTSSLPMEDMLGADLAQTLSLLEQSHMTFLGPNCPVIGYEEYGEAIAQAEKKLGYRFFLAAAKLSGWSWSGRQKLEIQLKNTGTAPFYQNWPLKVYTLDENGSITDSQVMAESLQDLLGQGQKSYRTTVPKKWSSDGNYLAIGIEDPASEQPAILFAQEEAEAVLVQVTGR
ncbi:MAG: DUF4832 domain-containing protein [Lachnospiraceae bacterium]|nr:DUF4832 domain-containing protein [Lachnospiraceae bacterium]